MTDDEIRDGLRRFMAEYPPERCAGTPQAAAIARHRAAVNPRTGGRIRAELLQNGLVRVFDYASGLTATGWPDGRHHGGPVSLWQTWEQNGRERTPWAPAS
jgi:hypothetical protein